LKYREIISKKIGIKSREIIIHRISNDNRWIEFIHRIDWERNRSKPQKVVFYEYDNLKDKIVKK
jgi:radical SAM superfamily enzyme